ncbi:MAG: STAS domain-containing protein [Chitinispirillales bacterium]|jgi:anti-anti-sigma factor|nr:STAS domain-containing protein [Chitinispirillales bacterium]
MEITKSQKEGKIVLALNGRLDIRSAPKFLEALTCAFDEALHVELDFADLNHLSSSGLCVLLAGKRSAKEKNARMILVNVPEEVINVFEMTGFSRIIEIA